MLATFFFAGLLTFFLRMTFVMIVFLVVLPPIFSEAEEPIFFLVEDATLILRVTMVVFFTTGSPPLGADLTSS